MVKMIIHGYRQKNIASIRSVPCSTIVRCRSFQRVYLSSFPRVLQSPYKMFVALLSATLISVSYHVVAATSPSITISAGTLKGGHCSNLSSAVYYKSVPYARPPIGDLRFKAPQPYTDKYPNGCLDATEPAPACIQFGTEFAESGPASEDW